MTETDFLVVYVLGRVRAVFFRCPASNCIGPHVVVVGTSAAYDTGCVKNGIRSIEYPGV